MDNYKKALNKIKASDSFKQETIELLSTTAKNKSRKSNSKVISLIAASLAVIIAISIVFLPSITTKQNNFIISAGAATADNSNVLSSEDFTPIANISASQAGFIGIDLSEITSIPQSTTETTDNPQIENTAFFCLNVDGENIKKVTFDLNNGIFEVSQNVMYRVTDYTGKTDNYKFATSNEYEYLDTITFEYANQLTPIGKYYEGDWVTMNVLHDYNAEIEKPLLENLLNLSVLQPDKQEMEDEEYFEATFENFLNEMYKDTEIYVTVEFENGKTKTKTLKLKADCEIIGTKEIHSFTGENYYIDSPEDESYEVYEVYDYTVDLCAQIVD